MHPFVRARKAGLEAIFGAVWIDLGGGGRKRRDFAGRTTPGESGGGGAGIRPAP